MRFMNEWEIAGALNRYRDHPVLGPATATLTNLVEWTNSHSDGWAYWPKPCRAAARLQELVTGPPGSRYDRERADATPAALAAALRPIKSFRTRQGADFKIEEAS